MRRSFLAALTVCALLSLSASALAAEIHNKAGAVLTAFQKAKGYASQDNVVGKLTVNGKAVGNVKVVIRDPKGDEVGSGYTDADGDYDIDTTLDDVSGWTLTFQTDHIDGEMTL